MNEDNARRNDNRWTDDEFDPRVADFVTALDDFAEAAWALDEAWQIASESVDAAADDYPFPNSFEEVAYSIWRWSREAIKKLTARPERAEEEGRAGSEPDTGGGVGRLTLEDIERLPSEEFKALPEGLRRRYFDHMNRENFPSPAEFYGDCDPERDGDPAPAEAFDDEKWTADAESCESHVDTRRPMVQDLKKVAMTLEGLDGNAFVLLTTFARQAKRQGWTPAEVEAVLDEARSADYDHLLQTLIAHVEEPNDD